MGETKIQIHVTSDSGSQYVIDLKEDGSFWCSCPAMRFQKQLPAPERHCKHTDGVTHRLAVHYANTHPSSSSQ
jgi:predicted nucleic acid-binding Zn finger protein